MNLAVNARDAMPEGGTIVIQTTNVNVSDMDARQSTDLKPGDYVMLGLADNGVGMDRGGTQSRISSRSLPPSLQGAAPVWVCRSSTAS